MLLTDKQRDNKQTKATKNITSFCKVGNNGTCAEKFVLKLYFFIRNLGNLGRNREIPR